MGTFQNMLSVQQKAKSVLFAEKKTSFCIRKSVPLEKCQVSSANTDESKSDDDGDSYSGDTDDET